MPSCPLACCRVGHRWGQLRAEGSTTAEKVVRYSIGVDSPSSQSYTFGTLVPLISAGDCVASMPGRQLAGPLTCAAALA